MSAEGLGMGAILTFTGIGMNIISSSVSSLNVGLWGWFLILLGVIVLLGSLRSMQ